MKPNELEEQAEAHATFLEQISQGLYLFPHEFLSLACNAKRRVQVLDKAFKPDFGVKKQEFRIGGDGPQDHHVKFHLYEMQDLKKLGEGGARTVLAERMELDFGHNLPVEHEIGIALPLNEA